MRRIASAKPRLTGYMGAPNVKGNRPAAPTVTEDQSVNWRVRLTVRLGAGIASEAVHCGIVGKAMYHQTIASYTFKPSADLLGYLPAREIPFGSYDLNSI
jgi:hypothetical protein